MNKKNYTIKDYRKELKGIYRIKDISQFKQELKKLYSKNWGGVFIKNGY